MTLHITAPAPFGGLERIVQALAIGQRESGHEVHVVAVVSRAAEADSFLSPMRDAGVMVHPLAVPARGYLRERDQVRALCRAHQPDVVHTHGYRPDVVDAGVARGLGIPSVTTVHGFTGNTVKNKAYEWFQRAAFRRFQAVVAVSRKLEDQLSRSGVPRARLHMVRNAWRPLSAPLSRDAARRELGLDGKEPVIGWVGRLSPEKGPDLMLEALALAGDLNARVLMIGDGTMRATLAERTAALGLTGRVRWVPAVRDAARLYAAFDVFALSSRTEGTPVVILEAMAAGIPIVATAVGGVPDMLTPAEAGLAPPEQPRALAEALRQALAEPEAAAQRARDASARLERDFGLAPWLAAYDRIYRGITTDARRNA